MAPNRMSNRTRPSSTNTLANSRESWGATLGAILPLVAFGCVCVMDATARLSIGAGSGAAVMRLLWADSLQIATIPIVFYLVLLGGLLAAWLKGFPRWSFSYLGWLLLFLIASLGSAGADSSYVWRIWGPFVATLLLAIVLRPSPEPLRALARSWKQDWTLSLLAGLGILPFLNTFDEMPGPMWARPFWLAVCTVVMVLGVLAYMRISHDGGRAVALLSSAALGVALGIGVRAYYWNEMSDSLIAWSLWFAVLMVPALLSAVLKRLRLSRPMAA